ncbi:MAG: HPr family phosphocarrier protein [Candidatus Kinetoplastibacterium crithidii]|nr:MAG: HPr family phosphocarrier protein [Candidatus Kinetoplastibacterium crithidii]
MTIIKSIVLNKKNGLDVSEASKLTKIASQFRSEVFISCDARKVNAKSIMGIMMLAAGTGKHITIEVSGPDSEEAIKALDLFFCDI